MAAVGGDTVTVKFVSNEKIAETSSKGNQEKWFEKETNTWYKIDQFGYEALAETFISKLLARSNIESETPFTFVRYEMQRLHIHGRDRTGCASKNFLKEGQSIITLNHLFSRQLGTPLKDKLERLGSDKKRMQYLAEATAEYTELAEFPQYLTLLFETDALFLNDDRHLNNIAILEQNGKFGYCPIFDNGAGLLSNVQFFPMEIAPKGLMKDLVARPFHTSFNRQINTARTLYGEQLKMPALTRTEIMELLIPMLEYYPVRDRSIIADRVTECILARQKCTKYE